MSVKRCRENQLIELQAAQEADPGEMRANQTTTWRSKELSGEGGERALSCSVRREARASQGAHLASSLMRFFKGDLGQHAPSETESEGVASEIGGWSLLVACSR